MKFAVRLIKNAYHPIKVPEGINLQDGQMVIVRTEKGEEVHKVELVNCCVANKWQKKMPEELPLVRIMNEQDMQTYKEQRELEVKALLKCREFAKKRNLNMNLTKSSYTFD